MEVRFRAVMALRRVSFYHDQQLVTRGTGCCTPQCQVRMHSHCFKNYRRRHQACPTCKASWSGDNESKLVPVGEAAFQEGQDQMPRRVPRKSTEEAEEDEDDGEGEPDDDADGAEPSQAPVKPNGRDKGKKKARAESMDQDADDSPPPQRRKSARRG